MRAVWISLVAVLVGVAMVGGGVWGVVDDVSDDDGSSSASTDVALPKTSSIEDCAQVARRDPRFELPQPLSFGFAGQAIVQCKGGSVSFTLDLDEGALEPTTFYEIVLEKGRRELNVGSMLTPPSGVDWSYTTVTVGPEVRLRRYDWLTVRVNEFHHPDAAEASEPLRAPL